MYTHKTVEDGRKGVGVGGGGGGGDLPPVQNNSLNITWNRVEFAVLDAVIVAL